MPLVHCRNARDRTGLMIENLVCHVRRNSEPGHAGHAGPAQIMEPPVGHSLDVIKQAFGMREVLEALGSER